MTYGEFDEWKRELLFNGIIVQDADESVPWPDREDRFNRYVKLVEGVKGTEGWAAASSCRNSAMSRSKRVPTELARPHKRSPAQSG